MEQSVWLTPGLKQRLEARDGAAYQLEASPDSGGLAASVIAWRRGDDLRLVFADGGELIVDGFFETDASVSGPDGLMIQASEKGAAAPEGEEVLLTQGSKEEVMALAREVGPVSLLKALDEVFEVATPEAHQAAASPLEASEDTESQTASDAGPSGGGLLGLMGLGVAALGAAAGGGGGGSGEAPGTTLSGQLMAGPFVDGTDFEVYLYDAAGEALLDGKPQALASDGSFTFDLPADIAGEPIIVHAVNAGPKPDYMDEATGQLVDASSNFMTVLNPAEGPNTVSVTPLTTIAAQRLGIGETQNAGSSNVKPALPSASARLDANDVEERNAEVAEAFGLSDIVTERVEPTISADGTATIGTASAYGKVLAALSGVHEERGGRKADVIKLYADSIETTNEGGALLNDSATRKLASGADAAELTGTDLVGDGTSGVLPFGGDVFDEVTTAKEQTRTKAVWELADFEALGINGVTNDNINAVNDGISATRAERGEPSSGLGVGEVDDIVQLTLSSVTLASDTGQNPSDGITRDGRLKVRSDLVDLQDQAFEVEYRSDGRSDWAPLKSTGTGGLTLDENGEVILADDVLPTGVYENLEFRLVTETANGKLVGDVYDGMATLEIDRSQPVLDSVTLSTDGQQVQSILWDKLTEQTEIAGPLIGAAETLTLSLSFDSEDIAAPRAEDFVVSGADFSTVERDANDPKTWHVQLTPTRTDEGPITLEFSEGAFADIAGNAPLELLPISLDYDPVAPEMALATWGDDGLVSASTLNFGFTHTLFENVSGDVAPEDVTVTLTSNEGEVTPTGLRLTDAGKWRLRLEESEIAQLLTPEDLKVGGALSDPQEVSVTVTATDTAGNITQQSDTFTMERPRPTSHSASTVVAGDNIVNRAEAEDGEVLITGTTSYMEGWTVSDFGPLSASFHTSGYEVTTGVVDANGDWESTLSADFIDEFNPQLSSPVLEGIWRNSDGELIPSYYDYDAPSNELTPFSIDQIAPDVTTFAWLDDSSLATNQHKAEIVFSEEIVTGFDNEYGADDAITAEQFEVSGGQLIELQAVEGGAGSTFELTVEADPSAASDLQVTFLNDGVTDIAGNPLSEVEPLPLIA